MEKIKLLNNKKIILLILMLIITVTSIVVINNFKTTIMEKIEAKYYMDYSEYEEVGQNAYISSAIITEVTTGVAPFDETSDTDSSNVDGTTTWTAGDDISEDDNIVRSFDQITWTVESTFNLKDPAATENYSGGVLKIVASIPKELSGIVKWDLDSMAWAENTSLSDDETELTAYYTMTDTDKTVPGKQGLVFVLKVYGASNGSEITPDFTISLYGNDEEDEVNIIGETVYVSATGEGKYNIKLSNYSRLSKKVTLDYDEQEVTGRIYGYGIILQLYNDSVEKGLKGIEYPEGNITFDINLNLERTNVSTKISEDITDDCIPLLWDYKINSSSNIGNLGRDMRHGNDTYRYLYFAAPYGTATTDREVSVYNSGNITITQEGSTLHVTISEYEFDGVFPEYTQPSSKTSVTYTNNIGCFSVGYFQILVPDNEYSLLDNYNYYLTAKDTNFVSYSSSGNEITKQALTTDDTSRVTHVIYKTGSYSQDTRIYGVDGPSEPYYAGTGYATRGKTFIAWVSTTANGSNDEENTIYTINKLVKFDGDCFEPYKSSTKGYFYTSTAEFTGEEMTYKMWFVTKKDGTNWESQEERNNATINDLVLYENIEDIPDGYICVGEYFESQSGYLQNGYQIIYLNLKVKETAVVGNTYAIIHNTQAYTEQLDRSEYTITNENVEWPTAVYNSKTYNYIKTEYDQYGTMITGTHSGGCVYGQTLLIVGADLSITKTAIDEEEETKTNYDFSKNEYNVMFQLTPTLSTSVASPGATLEITDTLPKGMTYVAGSSNYEEPQITENTDGTTTLVWYLYGVTSSDDLTKITYQAHLDELLENGTQLESTVIIREVPNIDEDDNATYLIGNTVSANRTYTTAIQVINLSSYSFYKTTETPVIEANGIIHYKITLINKTDETINDFQLLDILPYNGDERGTSYNGTYTISSINITQINTATESQIDNDNLSLYITSAIEARQAITAKDEDLGKTSIWTTAIQGEEINEELTAYAVIGTLKARTRLEIDIYLETDDNEANDLYKNSATAQTDTDTEVMETSIITVQTVKRSIEGYVWYDEDGDGLISEAEEYLKGVTVTLLNADGTTALDIKGNEISSTITDENGYYYFENMVRGNYIIQFQSTDGVNYYFTEKEVGSNIQINSKVDETGTTDIIKTLDSIDNSILIENYVNAGISFVEITTSEEFNSNEDLTYNIYTKTDGNGVIIPSSTTSKSDEVITFTVTPNDGYELDTLTITDSNGNSVTYTSGYKFTMPSANVTIEATFNKVGVNPPTSDINITLIIILWITSIIVLGKNYLNYILLNKKI